MLGTNPIRKQELRGDGALEVEKVFYTIQGEGPYVGRPSVFVRLSGCWLACTWCDTEFDTVNQVTQVHALIANVEAAARKRTRLIVLTGGDPLRQNIVPFCVLARAFGYHVQIETAGIQWVRQLEDLVAEGSVSIVVSPKTGKVCDEMHEHAMAWKYIVSSCDDIDPDDSLPVSSTQVTGSAVSRRQRLARPDPFDADKVYVQPCQVASPSLNFENVELTKKISLERGYRLSLQTHKILGLE